MIKCILNLVSPKKKLEQYDRYLFIGPHPDDIEIGAGATAAKLAAMGKTIRFVVVTDGRYGLGNAPAGTTSEALIEIRKQEAIASAALLGVKDVVFLGFSDGARYEYKDMVKALAQQIGAFNAEVIFGPDPSLENECHKDHLMVGEAVRELAFFAPLEPVMKEYGAKTAPVFAVAFYYTRTPNTFVRTGRYFKQQLRAVLEAHISQFPSGCADAVSFEKYLRLRSFFMGASRLTAHAEGFRMLDRLRMHVVAEA